MDASSRFLRRLGGMGSPGGVNGIASRAPLDLLRLAAAGASDAPLVTDGGFRLWGEAYGLWSEHDSQGSLPEDEQRIYGFSAGVAFDLAPGATLGLGIDHGSGEVELDAVSESAETSLTQLGAHAGFASGPFVGSLAAIYGFGSVDAEHSGGGGTSTASYDINSTGLFAEAGFRLPFDMLQLTPRAGLDWVQVDTDSFSESGGFALEAPDAEFERTRGWLGISLDHDLMSGESPLALSAYGRWVHMFSGRERSLAASFVSLPGTPLTIDGLSEDANSAEFGASLAARFAPNMSLYLAYDGRFSGDGHAHAASGGIAVRW
jgi:outer membrane autotransporter protein